MKSIKEHLQSLPEPYSTLALKNMSEHSQGTWGPDSTEPSVETALSHAFVWASTPEGHAFWKAVERACGAWEPWPTIPVETSVFTVAAEPVPPAPACVFKVGKIYKSRGADDRRVVHINPSGERPVISLRMASDGTCIDASIKHTLGGSYSADGMESPLDLIPPAPPKKRVPLGPEDVPPGTVFRGPGFSELGWSSILASGSKQNGVVIIGTGLKLTVVSYQAMMDGGAEILLPNTTVWQKCEKEVDA